MSSQPPNSPQPPYGNQSFGNQPFGNQAFGGQQQPTNYPPQQPHEGQPQYGQQPYYPPQQQPGMYPQQQPMMPPQQPPKKKRNPLVIGCGAALAVILVIVVIVIVNAANAPKSSPTTGTTSTGSTTQATSAPATSAPATWKTIQSFSGNGIKKTAIFAVPGDWRINYTCQGQSVDGITADGALAVTVYGSDGTLVDVAVNATCTAGKTTKDSTEEHQAGNVYLSVDSTGDWTMTIQALQ